jgi:hypothetical protein
VKKLATFCYVVGVFLIRKLKLVSKHFKLGKQRKVNPFVFRPITRGQGAGGVVLECADLKCRGDNFGRRNIELRSAKTEECDS